MMVCIDRHHRSVTQFRVDTSFELKTPLKGQTDLFVYQGFVPTIFALSKCDFDCCLILTSMVGSESADLNFCEGKRKMIGIKMMTSPVTPSFSVLLFFTVIALSIRLQPAITVVVLMSSKSNNKGSHY